MHAKVEEYLSDNDDNLINNISYYQNFTTRKAIEQPIVEVNVMMDVKFSRGKDVSKVVVEVVFAKGLHLLNLFFSEDENFYMMMKWHCLNELDRANKVKLVQMGLRPSEEEIYISFRRQEREAKIEKKMRARERRNVKKCAEINEKLAGRALGGSLKPEWELVTFNNARVLGATEKAIHVELSNNHRCFWVALSTISEMSEIIPNTRDNEVEEFIITDSLYCGYVNLALPKWLASKNFVY